VVVLVLTAIFSPSLYARGWHLRHKGVLSYKDKHVIVPPGWIASAKPQGLDMTKLPLTIFTGFQLTWIARGIHLYKGAPLRNQTLQQAEESFQMGFLTYPPIPSNAIISGPIQMGTSPNDVFCMKAMSPYPAWPVTVNCILQQGVWNASFIGEEKDVGTFYKILHFLQ
jgi:hypothetical protein